MIALAFCLGRVFCDIEEGKKSGMNTQRKESLDTKVPTIHRTENHSREHCLEKELHGSVAGFLEN